MKMKYLIIVFFFGISNNYSQTTEQRNAITNSYDLTLLNNLYNELNIEHNSNYASGLHFINTNGLPFDGHNSDGSYFSLRGFNEEINNIEYHVTYNNTATRSSIQTARVQGLHNGNSINKAIKGENIIYGIWDGAQPLSAHQNLGVTRVINKDGQGFTGGSQSGINHATHVSGTIIGSGNERIFAKGMAPLGKLWANTWENDLAEMTLEASEGLLFSNHSYGINNRAYVNLPGFFGRYAVLARSIDEITFNANMYQPVYAAGNDRNGIYVGGSLTKLNPSKNGYDLLTHERVGKNPVVVAAVHGITNYVLETNGTNNVEMSTFSQWGPTDDFRIKPDISAKGVSVYSSTGTGVANYSILSGTSMAAPAVTGVFGLWQQIYNQYWPSANGNSGFMKAASLKALMAHTADHAGDSQGPNPKFGWGLINADEGAKILKRASEDLVIFKEYDLLNYQTYFFDIYTNGIEPLKITIAWTDRPGEIVPMAESLTPVLVNDLDVRLTKVSNNQVAYPWKLNKSWSNIYAIKGDNDVDPIERIDYFDPNTGLTPSGNYRVTIRHKGELTGGSKNFSVIISGGIVSYDLTLDKEEFNKLNLNLFPNPATDYINITDVDFDSIELFDITGKKIHINEVSQDSSFTKLDINNLASGYYFIKLKKDSAKESLKFIKK